MPRGSYRPQIVVDTSNLTEEEWLDYRRGGIGGSDVSIIYGISHFRTGRELYYDKLGIKPIREIEDTTWLQKKIGHVLEEVVAELFAYKTGLTVYEDKKMYSHPLYPFMRADVDRFVITKNGKKGLLECKTTNYENKDAWADGKFPYQYELQVRHYLAVMNLDFAYIACLWGNNEKDFVYRCIKRDIEFEDEIIEMEQNFWNEYIVKKVEPPFVESPDMALRCLSRYLASPSSGYSKKTLPSNLQDNIEKYLILKEQKSKIDADSKKLEEEIKRLSIPIIEEMGSFHESVLNVSGKSFKVSYKPKKDVRIKKDNLEKLAVHHKEIYDEYVSKSESRTLSIKEMKVS